jgi:ankyrin repeat protein
MMKHFSLAVLSVAMLGAAVFAGNASAAVTSGDFFTMIERNDEEGVRLAIEGGFRINGGYDNKIPIFEAIHLVRPEIVKTLLESGADIEQRGASDNTPLIEAIWWAAYPESEKNSASRREEAMKIFDLLLDHGADVNYVNIFGWTALGQAAAGMNYETALTLTEKLLDMGADVNPALLKKEHGQVMPPLAWALISAYTEREKTRTNENRATLVRFLLDAGADPNVRLEEGNTPIHVAAMVDYEVTKLLLDAGADKTAKNDAGKTPFDLARELWNIGVMALLLMK